MKLLSLSLLLLFTIIYPASYHDNQTDIYVKEYNGGIVNAGEVSYQDSRIVIGVKENVTKDEVAELAKSFGGEISGWTIVPSLYDSYSIDLPAEKREPALFAFKHNPKIVYAIRNDVDQTVLKTFYLAPQNNETYSSHYYGEIIPNNHLVNNRIYHSYFNANTILLEINSEVNENEVEKILLPYQAKIVGYDNYLGNTSTYELFIPADQRELAINELVKNSKILSADRNYYYESFEPSPNSSGCIIGILLLFLLIVATIMFFVYKKLKKRV